MVAHGCSSSFPSGTESASAFMAGGGTSFFTFGFGGSFFVLRLAGCFGLYLIITHTRYTHSFMHVKSFVAGSNTPMIVNSPNSLVPLPTTW